MNSQCIVIIDPRGVIDLKDKYTINRHIRYAEQLKKKSHMKLVIISAHENSLKHEYENLLYIAIKSNNYFSPLFASKSVIEIQRNNLIPRLFVAGDPWESYETSRYVARKMNTNRIIPIQVQLHADVFDPNWHRSRIINKIRFLWCKKNLRKVDSIRLVSQAQLEHFPNESQILKKIFINPVSLNLTINPPKYDRNRPNSIGFVGRIENDRGLGDLMIILDKLRSLNSDIKIVIAGKGKKSKFLIRKLSKIMPRSRILYLKHLDPEGMTKAWSKIGVLLSTAKTESYGRVMREAACYGIPVISVENSGSLLLSREIPKGWLEFVDPSESSESIANKFHKTRMQKTSSIFLRHTLREENMNIEILIASWIGLSKK